MKRRLMILGSVGFFATGYAGTVAFGALSPCKTFEVDNPVFASARRIGNRLVALGFDTPVLYGNDFSQFHARLPEQVRRDYAAGAIVVCDGWVLADSEARFCVMCSKVADFGHA